MSGGQDLLSFLAEGGAFPRGKSINPASYQQSVINKREIDDNLFKNNGSADSQVKPSKKRRAPSKDSAEQAAGSDNDTVNPSKKAKDSDSSPSTVPCLKFRSLVKGMSMLGAIKEIHDLELTVCLPNNLVGTVAITEISDEITAAVRNFANNDSDDEEGEPATALPDLRSMFSLGQLFCCVVTEIQSESSAADGPKKRVELSLRPELVNAGLDVTDLQENTLLQGTISSREDHGYTVNIGMKERGVSAFLLNKDAKLLLGDKELSIGQPINCTVKKMKANTRVIPVTIDPACRRVVATEAKTQTIGTIKPGMLVNAKVQKVLEDGLWIKFLGYFNGCVTWQHAVEEGQRQAKSFDTDLRNLFKPDQKFRARILYVYPDNEDNMFVNGKNRIGLSLKSNIIQWAPHEFPEFCAVGTVNQEAVVSRVQKDLGVTLTISSSDATAEQQQFQSGFVHISRVSDSHTVTLDAKQFKLGSIHPVRILSHDYLDGIVNATMQKSVIEMPFFTYSDIKVGQIINNAVVQKLDPVTNNLIVLLHESSGIRALCPPTHLADVPRLTQPEKRFKIGGKVKVRVLSVDPDAKRVTVTCKKTLINTELPLFSDMDQLKQQETTPLWSHGVVSAVKPYGLIVGFFSGVKGLVHISQISEQRTTPEDLAKHYTPGQIVKCRLVSIAEDRLKLSLISDSSSPSGDYSQFKIGQLVGPATVHTVSKDMIVVHLSIDGNTVQASLPRQQISDHPQHFSPLLASVKPGDVIKQLVVIHCQVTSRPTLILSTKPSLLHVTQSPEDGSAVTFPSQFDQLEQGMVFVGFVRRVDNIGVFVQTGGQLCGLAAKSQLSDTYVSNINEKFLVGQTVVGVVSAVDTEKRQFSISLKSSDLSSASNGTKLSDQLSALRILYATEYFEENARIQRSEGIKKGFDLEKYKIGHAVAMKFKNALNFGVLLQSEDGLVDGLITKDQMENNSAYADGQAVEALVLDIDPVKSVIDLSDKKLLLKEKPSKKQKLQPGKDYPATVLLVKQDYFVVKIDSLPKTYGFAMCKDFNDQSAPFKRITPGISVKVLYSGKSDTNNRTLFVNLTAAATKNTTKSGSQSHPIANSVDPSISSLEDFKVGVITKGIVRSIKDMQMNIMLARGDQDVRPSIPAVVGRVHVSEVFDSIEATPETKQNLFHAAGFKQGAKIDVKIIGAHDAKTHRWLPITRLHGGKTVLELSARSSDLLQESQASVDRVTNVNQLSVGSIVTCFINEVITKSPKYALWASIGTAVRAHVPILELASDPKVLATYEESFWPGKPVRCRITAIDAERSVVEASFLVDKNSPYSSASQIHKGDTVTGKIVKKSSDGYIVLMSSLSSDNQLYGRVGWTDISDDFGSADLSVGQYIRGTIVELDAEKSRIDLSTRKSVVEKGNAASPVIDKCIESAEQLSQGDLLRGFVKSIADTGIFVAIGRGLNARVKISELSDDFVKEWKSLFSIGQLVKGRIIEVGTDGKVEMSLKLSLVDPAAYNEVKAKGRSTLETLQIGARVSGTIVRVEPFGVFVELDSSFDERRKSALRGMCHRSELDDTPVKSASEVYSAGDRVIVIVQGIDKSKRQIQLCMKPSVVNHQDSVADSNSGVSDSDEEMSDVQEESDASSAQDDDEVMMDACSGIIDDQDSSAESGNDDDKMPAALSLGFDWNASWEPNVAGDSEELDDSSSDDDSDDADAIDSDSGMKKRSKREKARLKRDEEQRLAKRERELASNTPITPESADDFDRALLASPNSSFLWIQYMAFYVNLVEVDKARFIAERALKTINFREEKEKFNIWLAYLNLENKYGSVESLNNVFDRATTYNEPKHVYLALAKIYERTEKIDAAEELYETILKKFKSSSKVWVQNGLYYYVRGQLDKARAALQRSLQALSKRKHIKTIIKFAQFEFRYGDSERGRTIFEGIVANYPKRIDIWSIYIDMNIKTGEIQTIRRLFERVLQLKMSSKKMKFFFKKYLDFEKKFGEEESVQHVVQLAKAYVESVCGETEQ